VIGIVVVSHSPRLASAAVELALEMVPGEKPAIAIAAGTGDGMTGTDAVRVSEAITAVSSPEGVLVMMDLGSAVLSAEMAIEFIAETTTPIKLSSAPFVEGLLAAVVMAAGGASLEAVEGEARGALRAKRSQLGVDSDEVATPVVMPIGPGELSCELEVANPDGLHARPAALLVGAIAGLSATVTLANLRTCTPPVAVTGPTSILVLAARMGDRLTATASGADGRAALDAISDLVRAGFGELDPPVAALRPDGRSRASTGPMGVSPGRVVGPVLRMPEPVGKPAHRLAVDIDSELRRITEAATAVEASLRERAARVTGDARAILEAGALMATDQNLLERARGIVTEQTEGAELATWIAVTEFADVLAEQGGRMAERVSDVLDVRNRLVASLIGQPAPGVPVRTEPFVLIASDLAPADTALLDAATCLALVTEQGGPTSHTAILARSLGIPAVVAATGALEIPEGTILLVDGTTGRLQPNPSAKELQEVDNTPQVAAFSGSGATKDGHAVQLLANVGSPESVASAVEAAAEGVGLFRTEFCFLDRDTAPTVEEQVAAYRPVFAAFPGRKVVVRTLDAGADKPLAFVTASTGENPALGIRGLRTSWRQPTLLNDQLRAIALAAATEKATVWVMAPMVATLEEAEDFAAACARHGIASSGVMIETPAAALLAPEVNRVVSFTSLGTNDLSQYTMAADRLVGELAALNDPWQPAVLRLIDVAAAAASAEGKPVGVCGEAAADPLLAVVLVGMGITSLSMSARAIAAVAARLGETTLEECQRAARVARDAATASQARQAVVSLFA